MRYKGINKTDGGKRRARRAYHKAERQAAKRVVQKERSGTLGVGNNRKRLPE